MKKLSFKKLYLILVVVFCLGISACSADYDADSNVEESFASEDEKSVSDAVEPEEEASADSIDEDGTYDSKEEVSLYIHTYDKLPSNYITKKEAKALGWEGGSLEDYAPGKCIGGDYFGNYEGNLPEDDVYHECDIDTLGASSRGAKRIVYSEDGDIYYTEDHYNNFEQIYGE